MLGDIPIQATISLHIFNQNRFFNLSIAFCRKKKITVNFSNFCEKAK